MPAAVLIPLIAAGITAGAGIYEAKSAAGSQSDALKAQQQATLTQQRQDAVSEANTRRQALLKAAPGLQENVGGSLTPDSFSSIISQLTGNPGNVGLAQSTLFPQNGLQQNQNEPGLSDAMDHLFGGGGGGSTGGVDSSSLTMPY